MSQPASLRFRPNREIIWHPERYLPESRGKRKTTLIVCGLLIPQTGNKHFPVKQNDVLILSTFCTLQTDRR